MQPETNRHTDRIDLDLPLKGERKYLQSANILSALIEQFDHLGPVKLEFRKMIYNPIYVRPVIEAVDNFAGKFSMMRDGAWETYGLYVDDSRQIERRIPNNETEILAASTRDGDSSEGPIDRPGNFIDTIVALNKVVVAPYMATGQKAIFTNIVLDVIPDRGSIGVALTKKMGTRIFVSDVLWNKDKIGTLTFMTV